MLVSMIVAVSKEEILGDLSCAHPNMTSFDKADLPKRLHYARHDRIDPVIHKMADTWQVDR